MRHLAQWARGQNARGVEVDARSSSPSSSSSSFSLRRPHRHRLRGSRYANARVVSDPTAPTPAAAATAVRRGTPAHSRNMIEREREREVSCLFDFVCRPSGFERGKPTESRAMDDVPTIAAPHTTAAAAMYGRARSASRWLVNAAACEELVVLQVYFVCRINDAFARSMTSPITHRDERRAPCCAPLHRRAPFCDPCPRTRRRRLIQPSRRAR